MPTIFEQFMQGRQLAQQQALQQLKMQQAQQLFPIEQQLKQLQMERERQMIAVAQQKQESSEFDLNLKKGQRIMNLATNALKHFDSDPDLAKSIMIGGAQREGLDIGDVETITKDQLKSFIEQNRLATTKLNIKSSRIFDDGTMISQTDKGPVVFDPSGKQLTGTAAENQIQQANKFETALQRGRTLGRETASQSIELSGKAFEQLPAIRKNMANLDEAERLINQGAKTGAVLARLPSVRNASIELDNLRGQLGLDVVGLTTFGALSGSELNLALDVGLPTKLDEEELIGWINRKREAQTKVYNILQDAAVFLGRGGSIAEYMDFQKNAQQSGIPAEDRRIDEDEAIQERSNDIQAQIVSDYQKLPRDEQLKFLNALTDEEKKALGLSESKSTRFQRRQR